MYYTNLLSLLSAIIICLSYFAKKMKYRSCWEILARAGEADLAGLPYACPTSFILSSEMVPGLFIIVLLISVYSARCDTLTALLQNQLLQLICASGLYGNDGSVLEVVDAFARCLLFQMFFTCSRWGLQHLEVPSDVGFHIQRKLRKNCT